MKTYKSKKTRNRAIVGAIKGNLTRHLRARHPDSCETQSNCTVCIKHLDAMDYFTT